MQKGLIICMSLIVLGCVRTNPNAPFFIDTATDKLLLPSNSQLHLVNNPSKVRKVTLYHNGELFSEYGYDDGKLISRKNFGPHQSEMKYEYDEFNRIIHTEYVVESSLYRTEDFNYIWNGEGYREKHKYINSKLESIVTEQRHKNTYTYTESFGNTNNETITKLVVEGGRIIEYSLHKSKFSQEKGLYQYKKDRLVKMEYYAGSGLPLIFSFDYIYENDDLVQVFCYRHNAAVEKTIEYEQIYEDFDANGNWKKFTQTNKDGYKEIHTREITYMTQ